MIRSVHPSDAAQVAGIYNYYVQNTIITFEEETVPEAEMLSRINSITARFPWLVYEEAGLVKGYAYASAWKARSAYKNSVESTVYLSQDALGKGIGSQLYSALIEKLKLGGFHTVIGGIALPNESSVRLHEKLGFKKTAHFVEVGYKFERWIDVAYWQLLL